MKNNEVFTVVVPAIILGLLMSFISLYSISEVEVVKESEAINFYDGFAVGQGAGKYKK